MSSMEKYLFSSFTHFLIGSFIFLELSCRYCLYIFEINSLSLASFAIIFSHSEGCLFTLLIVSFVVQKFLSLIRSHFFKILFYLTLHSVFFFQLSSIYPLRLGSAIISRISLIPENIGKTLSDVNHSRILYDPPPRVMGIKAKINKWDLINLKSFCT